MLFKTMTLAISTQVKKDSGVVITQLTLTGGEVSDETVTNALISGQSPRVRIQNSWRSNGIPKVATISWSDYLSGKAPRVILPETPEQILERAKQDPAFLASLLEKFKIGQSDGEKQAGQDETDNGENNS